MRLKRWTDEQLMIAISNSKNYSEVMRKLGLKVVCGNWRTLKLAVNRLGLDVSHMTGKAHGTTIPPHKRTLEDVMVSESTYCSGTLKKRLLREGLLNNKCALCGQLPEWNGEPMVLVFDHINGIHNDNRMENLRLLCPNCNSQQNTFSGRNRKF